MGNDPRNISDASKAILTNADAIAVDQDALGQMGVRLDNSSAVGQQRWARVLANGDVAVALYNKASAVAPPIPAGPCPSWTHTTDGYYEACGGAAGNVGQFNALSVADAQAKCCDGAFGATCAGFSFQCDDASCKTGSGYFKGNAMCGITSAAGYQGFTKPACIPAPSNATHADITIVFADVNLYGPVRVYDIWANAVVGVFNTSFTAKAVAEKDSAFIRLSSAA
jgi:hypothetical protein